MCTWVRYGKENIKYMQYFFTSIVFKILTMKSLYVFNLGTDVDFSDL